MDTPTAGTFANPIDSMEAGWSYSVPSLTTDGDEVYVITRTLTSDGLTPQDASWSTPALYAVRTDGVTGPAGDTGQGYRQPSIYRLNSSTIVSGNGTYDDPLSGNSSWSYSVPSITNDLDEIYVSTRIFTSDGLAPQEASWSTPAIYAIRVDGAIGQATRSVSLYKANDSSIGTPTAGTFANPLDSMEAGWSYSVPSLTTDGDEVYIITRTFTSDGLAPQDASWSTPAVYAIRVDGVTGATGDAGQGYRQPSIYRLNSSTIVLGNGTYADPLSGNSSWSYAVPTITNDLDEIYVSTRIFTSDGLAPQEASWSAPAVYAIRVDGDTGATGATGDTGATGPDGRPGLPGAGILLEYDDLQGPLVNTGSGQYNLWSTIEGDGTTVWSQITSSDIESINLTKIDSSGANKENELNSVRVGDHITFYVSSGKWVDYAVTEVSRTGDAFLYEVEYVEHDDTDGTSNIDANPNFNITFRFSRPEPGTGNQAEIYGFNPSFEAWFTGETYPEAWLQYASTPNKITSEVTQGKNAVGFTVGWGTDAGIYQSNPINYHIDSAVIGSIDVYISTFTGGGSPGLMIDLVDGTSYHRHRVPADTSIVGSWQTINFATSKNLSNGTSVGTPTAYDILRVYVMGSDSDMSGGRFRGTVYFDNLRLEVVSPNVAEAVAGANGNIFGEDGANLEDIDLRNDQAVLNMLNAVNINPSMGQGSTHGSFVGPLGYATNSPGTWPLYVSGTKDLLLISSNVTLNAAAIKTKPGVRYEVSALVSSHNGTSFNIDLRAEEYNSVELDYQDYFIGSTNVDANNMAGRDGFVVISDDHTIPTSGYELVTGIYTPQPGCEWFSPSLYANGTGNPFRVDWFIVREVGSASVDFGGLVHNSFFNNIDSSDGTPAGWYLTNSTMALLSYADVTSSTCRVDGVTDNYVTLVSTAIPINPNTTYKIRVKVRATNTTTANTFFIRPVERDTDLNIGKVAIRRTSEADTPDGKHKYYTDDATREDASWGPVELIGSSTWEVHEMTYTPTSTAKWMSINLLCWDSAKGYFDFEYVTMESRSTEGADWDTNVDNLPTNLDNLTGSEDILNSDIDTHLIADNPVTVWVTNDGSNYTPSIPETSTDTQDVVIQAIANGVISSVTWRWTATNNPASNVDTVAGAFTGTSTGWTAGTVNGSGTRYADVTITHTASGETIWLNGNVVNITVTAGK